MEKKDLEIDIDNNIAHIAKELIRGRVNFLFGAGMSIQSGGIPGTELAFKLITRSFYQQFSEDELPKDIEEQIRNAAGLYPLEAIAAGVEEHIPFQETELTSMLKQVVFCGKDPQIHQGHKDMAVLVERLNSPRLLFTTNWDNLIEMALGRIAVTVTNMNFMNIDLDETLQDNIAVAHINGTFEQGPLIKEDDLMSIDKPLFSLFLAELMAKTFVFVGYSLSDPNIRSLYFRANKILTTQRIQMNKKTYVVYPCKDEVDRRIATATWSAPSRNAIHIPLAADEFFKRLRDQVENKAVVKRKHQIAERLKIQDIKDLDAKIDEIKSIFPDLGTTKQVLGYLDEITRGGNS